MPFWFCWLQTDVDALLHDAARANSLKGKEMIDKVETLLRLADPDDEIGIRRSRHCRTLPFFLLCFYFAAALDGGGGGGGGR